MRRMRLALAALFAVAVMSVGLAQERAARKDVPPPNLVGDWTGTWNIYAPPDPAGKEAAKPNPAPKIPPMPLDCKVMEPKDGKWTATFEGECGRPYKYTIKMEGRQAGPVVLFKGSADLGEKDGGVFDWIGRATEKEFVGFYTSETYTGTFRLARPK